MPPDPLPFDPSRSDRLPPNGLSPDVERLLRSLDPVRAPAGLRARVLAAHDLGVRPVAARSGRGLLLRLAPFAAAAAVVGGVGLATLDLGGRSPAAPSRDTGALARYRVVDDPTLGLAFARDRVSNEAMLAGLLEGP